LAWLRLALFCNCLLWIKWRSCLLLIEHSAFRIV
jgi:hypothetical protein